MVTIPPTRSSRTFRSYRNFEDPVGLVCRMVLSGNRAAYGALARAGLSMGVTPFDWILSGNEQRRMLAADPTNTTQPIVLIVGPPRSGSTLLYQVMARYTDVSYFSNRTSLFPRSPITATRLLQGREQFPGKTFRSFYGQTAGLDSPNDGFEIWNRWLGHDRYRTAEVFDSATEDDIRRFFAAWATAFGRPLLNKNNRNVACLSLLARTLPQARFIIIRRDPYFVAQSLIQARQRVQGTKDRGWGLASRDAHAAANEPFGYVDDVCDQIQTIEQELQTHESRVDPARWTRVTYEEFCRQPHDVLRLCAGRIDGLRLREKLMEQELQSFPVSARDQLSGDERRRIELNLSSSPLFGGGHAQQAG